MARAGILYVVVAFDRAYGPFTDRAEARRIAQQVDIADDGPVVVVHELTEWDRAWTWSVSERIAATRRGARA